MPKNIIICCDGTSNRFGDHNTNIVRLVESAANDGERQIVYYDPGVGTLPAPGLSNPVKWLAWKLWTIADLMVGWGLESHVESAYRFLMKTWRPGDRVFLFGFSRGAYTVRVFAGLLHALGLLRVDNEHLVPYLLSMYKAVDSGFGMWRRAKKDAYWKLSDEFRRTFARDAGTDHRFPIDFVGLWDTVSSYGWLWNPRIYSYTTNNPSIAVARHAVSIDESRAFFRQNLFHEDPKRDIEQRWFPGVHCDVGGGYPETDSGLWRVAFDWMVREAAGAGMEIDDGKLQRVLSRSPIPAQPHLEPNHSSLLGKPWWWIAEFVPKLAPVGCHVRINLFRARSVPTGASIDRTAVLRIIGIAKYRPRNLSKAFVAKVIALPEVPDKLPYEP